MTGRLPVDIVILTGFLGSGKTTLLTEFLRTKALHDTAVIVNEVGEIGVDAAVLNESIEDDDVLMLDNGCVCCSLRSSLVDSVLRLLRLPRPEGSPPLARIVVETSGLSKPGPIVASLRDRDLVEADLRLMVVSTFDSTRLDDPAYYCPESLAQWAAAHRLVITKLDCLETEDESDEVIRRAVGLSPLGQVISSLDRATLVSQAFEPLDLALTDAMPLPLEPAQEPAEETAQENIPHADVLVLRGRAQGPVDWQELANWIDDMAGLCGERLLRFKALLSVQGVDKPVLLQSVGTTFSAPVRLTKGKAPLESVLILIVRQMNIEEFDRHLPSSPIRLSRFAAPPRRSRRVFDVPIVQPSKEYT